MKKDIKIFRFLSLTVIVALLLLPVLTNAQGSKANFAGKWAFNAGKSDIGQSPAQGGGQRMGAPGGGDFVARQEANLLTVDRTRTGQDGQQITTSSKYTLDGKVSINSTGRGESKSVATWSADGKTLTIVTTRTFERDGQSTEMKTTEAWTLTDANTLKIVSTMTTPNGERKTTAVYDKQ